MEGTHEPLDLRIRKRERENIEETGMTGSYNKERNMEDTNASSVSEMWYNKHSSGRYGYTDEDGIGDSRRILITKGGISLMLEDAHVWNAFNKLQTEMIISRNGRRMFPYLTVTVDGLKRKTMYDILLDIIPVDACRYKFINNEWVPISKVENQPQTPSYLHPDSPLKGSEWMARKISFAKAKLTNNREAAHDSIVLHSMYKYVACVSLVEYDDFTGQPSVVYPFCLKETSFIAVTAYQSNNIRSLKIQNNPFAKAFRASLKRKQMESSGADQ